MRTPSRWAVAVRRPDGEIRTESHTVPERWAMLRQTFARGLAALAEAVSIGLEALRISVRETTGIVPTAGQLRSTLAAAGAGVLAVFIVAPGVLVAAWPDRLADVLEAAIRATALVVYLLTVSRSAAARRLLAYHGAEHKVIAAFEKLGERPTIEQARATSPIHPRCGTMFIAIFVIVAGVVHAFVPRDPLWAGAAWRVLLLPVNTAIAYELMRTMARHERSATARVLSLPGRALQRVTTREPADDQLHVALAAFDALST